LGRSRGGIKTGLGGSTFFSFETKIVM